MFETQGITAQDGANEQRGFGTEGSPSLTAMAPTELPQRPGNAVGSSLAHGTGLTRDAAALLSHWSADGPFTPQVNGLLSKAFGQGLSGLSVSRGDSEKNDLLSAKAHTVGSRISLGSGIKEDPADPESMAVISHEVAHALSQPGQVRNLVDRPGDTGEHGAHSTGLAMRNFIEAGMQGCLPRLQPAHGGQARIQRWAITDHPKITGKALVQAGLLTPEEIGQAPPGTPGTAAQPERPHSQRAQEYEYGASWNDTVNDPMGAAKEFLPASLGGHAYGKQADNGTRFGPGDPLLPRTHYGDLSFLHAMVGPRVRDDNGDRLNSDKDKNGNPLPPESAQETQDKMVNWAKFTYAIQKGEFVTPDGRTMKIDGNTKLSDYPDFKKIFGNDPKLGQQSINQLFGNADGKKDVKNVAMGSLAHMVEDSFARGHVERDAQGRVVQFHTYGGQDPGKHGKDDVLANAPASLQQKTLDETSTIMKLAHDPKAKWTDIETQLRQHTFALAPNAKAAGPGTEYTRDQSVQPQKFNPIATAKPQQPLAHSLHPIS